MLWCIKWIIKLFLIIVMIGLFWAALTLIVEFIAAFWPWLIAFTAIAIAIYFAYRYKFRFKKCNFKWRKKKPSTIDEVIQKENGREITTLQELSEFCKKHYLDRSFITSVVGVTFDNDDGSSRQEILAQCLPGDPVAFYWHDFNGEPACAIITDYGQIGYLRASLAAHLDIECGDDCFLMGKISDILGGYEDMSYGCTIMVEIWRPI